MHAQTEASPMQWGAYGAPTRAVVNDSLDRQVSALTHLTLPSTLPELREIWSRAFPHDVVEVPSHG